MVRVGLDLGLKFSNGTFVFDSIGRQISPNSKQGKTIEDILAKQKVTRQENKTQRKKFERITGKDIDGDGKIGDTPVEDFVSRSNI